MSVEIPANAEFAAAKRLSPTGYSDGDLHGAMYEITFRMTAAQPVARPGQFYMVRPAFGSQPLLPRPLSPVSATAREITFGIRVHGEGTLRMARAIAGEAWSVQGPYGNGFDAPITSQEKIWLVGGGVGVPPLVHLANTYPARYTAVIGARSDYDLNWTGSFGTGGVYLSTDDGTEGFKGTAADLLRQMLAKAPRPDRVITCGPNPLMAAVASICHDHNIRCDVSLEERMACGTGICISCVCRIKTPDGNYRHARTCIEGPVFDAEEVSW